jgi:hypothetical protein
MFRNGIDRSSAESLNIQAVRAAGLGIVFCLERFALRYAFNNSDLPRDFDDIFKADTAKHIDANMNRNGEI